MYKFRGWKYFKFLFLQLSLFVPGMPSPILAQSLSISDAYELKIFPDDGSACAPDESSLKFHLADGTVAVTSRRGAHAHARLSPDNAVLVLTLGRVGCRYSFVMANAERVEPDGPRRYLGEGEGQGWREAPQVVRLAPAGADCAKLSYSAQLISNVLTLILASEDAELPIGQSSSDEFGRGACRIRVAAGAVR